MDPHVEYVLKVLGHLVASHVASRATLSAGTGRNEEPLTADLADLFARFDVCDAYLVAKGSGTRMRVEVADLNRNSEGKVGADFAVAVRVAGPAVRQPVYKLALVQAKRQDYATNHNYMASPNANVQARKMASFAGRNVFFGLYHNEAAIDLHHPATFTFGVTPPNFWYLHPKSGGGYYHATHPRLPWKADAFIEASAYRDQFIKARGWTYMPARFAHGVQLVECRTRVDLTTGAWRTGLAGLPTISTAMTNGACLPEFLVGLADCSIGDNLTDERKWRSALTGLVRHMRNVQRLLAGGQNIIDEVYIRNVIVIQASGGLRGEEHEPDFLPIDGLLD